MSTECPTRSVCRCSEAWAFQGLRRAALDVVLAMRRQASVLEVRAAVRSYRESRMAVDLPDEGAALVRWRVKHYGERGIYRCSPGAGR